VKVPFNSKVSFLSPSRWRNPMRSHFCGVQWIVIGCIGIGLGVNRVDAKSSPKRLAPRRPAATQAPAAPLSAQSVTFSMSLDANDGSRPNLRRVKESLQGQKYDECLDLGVKARKEAKALEPWILNLELQCAVRGRTAATSASMGEKLSKVLALVEGKPKLFLAGPWVKSLRENYVTARLQALEWDTKFNRARAWQHIEALSLLINGASASNDDQTRARYYRLIGDLCYLQQKTDAAKEFYRRSISEMDQPDLRDKLRALDPSWLDFGPSAPTLSSERRPDGTDDENELYDRIANAGKIGDLVASAEDSVKFLIRFPGSSRAKWVADRMLDSLLSVIDRSNEKQGEKFQPVKESLLKAIEPLEKSEPDRLADWMRVLYNKGHWPETGRIAKLIVSGIGQRSTKNVDLAMEALYAVEDWKGVRAAGEILLEKHAGTASARLAMLRLGLLSYREGDDAKAVSYLERLVASSGLTESLEIQARYWLWRSLQRSKSERAKIQADELTRRFPFSYYGLRVRIDKTEGRFDWPQENPTLEVKHWFTGEEKMAWERTKILVANRWFEEAQEEVKMLPNVATNLFSPEAKAVRAKVLAMVKSYPQAAKMANQAWDQKFELRRIDLMRTAFPDEYKSMYETAAKTKGLDAVLTRSLTKQESSFNPRALSTSNAMGLMQMIPPTAREIAEELKLGKLALPDDLFDPSRNVPMGTHYVAKMLNQFKGHVPLALAAYNAGPTRMDRWLRSRPSLKGLETTRTSTPEAELWIDELPYTETSQYVKSILRNILIYRMLDSTSVKAESVSAPPLEPLWSGLFGVTRP